MRTPLELRNDALDCLRQADRARAPQHKAILLILAQGWASLADEMERHSLSPAQDPDVSGGNGEPIDATMATLQPAGAN